MTKSKKMIIGTLPFVALIVLFAIFCGIVSSKGYRLDMYIKIVFNEGIVLSIVATGAIFIYTLGSFDISLGAATLFAATLGVMTYNATENIGWMILVIMLAGIGCSLLNSVLASISFIWRGYGLSLKREEKKYMNNKHWIKNLFGAIAIPLLVAILLQGLCIIKGRTMIANMTSFDNFVVYIAIVMITTIALSINLNSGRFDFSLGSMATLSSVLGAKITYSVLDGGNYSALMMFVLTLLIGMLLGLISGILYVVLHLPPIITSLGVTLIYEGILFTITEGRYVMKEVQNKSMTAFTGNWIYAAIIIVAVLLISIAIFDYTKFGYDYNALKNGQKVAVNTGIKEIPNAIGCYVICGGLMGIVGFLNAARNTTINGGQLNFGSISIMFTAFLPMFIGSYISRFTNEKIGFFLAALCMSMLNSTFAVFSNEVNASMQAIINAVLLVVFLIYLSNEQLLVKIFTGKRKA